MQEAQQKYADALQAYERARSVFHASGDRDGEARILLNISTVQWDRRDFAAALGSYQQARIVAHDLGDRDVEVSALMGIGDEQYGTGRVRRRAGFDRGGPRCVP